MKKIGLIMMCMLLATTVSVFAMDITVGGAAGVNMNHADVSEGRQMGSSIGFEAGVFANIAIADISADAYFSIQPELNFLLLRYGYEFGAKPIAFTSISSRAMVVEIPVLAKANFLAGPGKISVFAGPALQLVLAQKTEFEIEIFGINRKTENTDVDDRVGFAVVAGVDYTLPMGLILDARYRRGFTGAVEKANIFAFRVGYGLSL